MVSHCTMYDKLHLYEPQVIKEGRLFTLDSNKVRNKI